MEKPILRRSFNQGEVAPTMYYREDVQKLSAACRTMKNFLVHPHGAAVRRTGFERWTEIFASESDD